MQPSALELKPTAGWRIHLLELSVVEMPPAMVAPEGALTPPIFEAVNVLLLRRPEGTLLIDTGPGLLASWMPGLEADLDAALAETGSRRYDVDRVILTHLHFDHVGGLVTGSWPDHLQPAFPRAEIVLAAEAASAAREGNANTHMNAATTVIEVFDEAGKLRESSDGDTPAPGVELRATPGHAPGHTTVEIGGDNPLVFLGDIIHHPIHAHHPEWAGASDENQAEALTTRRQLIAELAQRRVSVVAPHLREPSVGRFERDGDAYAWVSATGP